MSIKSNKMMFFFYCTFLARVALIKAGENVVYHEERYALLQVRDLMNSSANLHAKWTGPPCHKNRSRWTGILCYDWHVTHIVLEGIQLIGSLPPTCLQNLTFLSKLSFRNNSIYGTLPNLTSLINLEFVFLSNNNFSGSIPSEYIQLPQLTELELQGNDLVGSIPPFDQQTLVAFNVSNNQLSGSIPETRALKSFPSSSYDHNYGLCGPIIGTPCPVPPPALPPAPPPAPSPNKHHHKKPLKVYSIALIAAAAVLVPFFVFLFLMCYYKKRQNGQNREVDNPTGEGHGATKKMIWASRAEDPERIVELEFFDKERSVFNLDDLLRASAEVLGKGKLGTTYKILMETGPAIAVKRLKEMNTLSKKDFVQQMQLLGKMRHENLVEIISFYYSKEEKLVIREFIPHGNLFELLHENRGAGRIPLNWKTRFSIIKDIAKALNFLHHSLVSHKVPHANLKSSNVLLTRQDDENINYQAKLSDFGFLPLLPSRKSLEKLAIAKSPEFSDAKKLTFKADVYCFGIILLQVITGKIPGKITSGFGEEEGQTFHDLSDWVRMVVNNDWSTDIFDMEILSSKEGHDEMLKLTELALLCTDLVPDNRPKMSHVLRKIQEIEQMSREEQHQQIEL